MKERARTFCAFISESSNLVILNKGKLETLESLRNEKNISHIMDTEIGLGFKIDLIFRQRESVNSIIHMCAHM